jgi:murein DD-endopeptidase MepM/ murein hydrolase activator NlpD
MARTHVKGPRLVAGVITTVLLMLTAFAGPAFADSAGDQRRAATDRAAQAARRAADLAASVEDLSATLAQAVLDLAATQTRLPIAQAALATAQDALDRTQREAALIAARLADAQGQETILAASIAVGTERGQELRAAVGQMARRAYKGETAATSLSMVMDAKNTKDFVDKYGMVSTAMRTQTKALDEADQVAATSRNGLVRLAAVKTKIAALKVEADQNVAAADIARAEASTRQAEVVQLIAEQSARQQKLEAMKAQAQAEQAQADADSAAFAAELAQLVARQRAAAAAARAAAAAAAAAAGRPAPPSDGAGSVSGALFANPTSTSPMYVTSEYGMRMQPVLQIYRLHAGIDLRALCGTPLYAPRAGTVEWAKYLPGYGNQVLINFGTVNGNVLGGSLNHMAGYVVGAGQAVSQGQLVGYSGATGGDSTGCHLHFEVYVNGATVNPRPLLGL